MPTLDGWRTVAITLVMLYHGLAKVFLPFGRIGAAIAGWSFAYAQGGVFLFFAISGLLITSRLIEERRLKGSISLRAFYIRRFFRILPPALTFLAVVALLALRRVLPIDWHAWWGAALSVQNYIRNDDWYVGHFWSLSIEEHFYLIWPGLLVLIGFGRIGGGRLAVLLALVVAGWRFANNGLMLEAQDQFARHRTDLQADALLWGCAAAFALDTQRGRAAFSILGKPLIWSAVMALLIVCATAYPHRWVARQTLVLASRLLVPALVAATVCCPRTYVGRFLESDVMRWVGRLSYSLYLWQELFMARGPSQLPAWHPFQSFPLNLLCALTLAIASFYLIEKPSIRLGHHLAQPTTEGRGDMNSRGRDGEMADSLSTKGSEYGPLTALTAK